MYSASAVLFATVGCLFEVQATGHLSMHMTNPANALDVSGSLLYEASVNIVKFAVC